jgi:hypothetical protein
MSVKQIAVITIPDGVLSMQGGYRQQTKQENMQSLHFHLEKHLIDNIRGLTELFPVT